MPHARPCLTFALALTLASSAAAPARAAEDLPALRASADGRYFVTGKGTPEFLQVDTAWELLHRLDRVEALSYLDARKAQGFNAVLAVALPELSIAKEPNAQGDFPLVETDPLRPAVTPGADPGNAEQYDFWDHVDFIVAAAHTRGLRVGMLPTWARWVNDGKDRIFDETKARTFGTWIATRYAHTGVFWVLGGDRNPKGFENIWRAMAAGLAAGTRKSAQQRKRALPPPFITFHPGAPSSVPFFHKDEWLGFNSTYTGHGRPGDNAGGEEPSRQQPWQLIAAALAAKPAKPVIDLEPIYEDIPYGIATFDHGYSSARDVRRSAYWDVFAGAAGAVYGNHATWQMWDSKHQRIFGPLMPWHHALTREGAGQLRHLRALMESRPYLSRRPAPALVLEPGEAEAFQIGTLGDGYAFVYSPQGRPVKVDLAALRAASLSVWHFDPRTGRAESGVPLRNDRKPHVFSFPTEGDGADWVLVLDDAGRGFGPPGAARSQ